MTSRLADILGRAAGKRVLVVGDIMLDRFIYGSVERISPEAPVPVLRHAREAAMPGGAANVARNLATLGLRPVLIGGRGDDEAGRELEAELAKEPLLTSRLVTLKDRPTTLKCRFVAGGHQLLRLDTEVSAEIDAQTEAELLDILQDELKEVAVILLSDYAKGLLSQTVLTGIVELAARNFIPVIADPKGRDFARYGAVDILKPNAAELAAATGLTIASNEDARAALQAARSVLPAKNIVVTRAAQGMSFIEADESVHHIAGRAREVFDVSGAGDTSLAAMAAAIAGGANLEEAVGLAILASGLAVGKAGTATVSTEEVVAAIRDSGTSAKAGLLPLEAMVGQVDRWRAAGLQIGFTNGCFDILHPGHIRVLEEAKAHCDRLIVGLNADASVARLKGPSRPVNDEKSRADVLAALSVVDGVTIFSEDTPLSLIEALCPDVLIKGGDYTKDNIIGADIVEARGGQVVIVPLVPGQSTTAIIARSRT